MKTFKLIKPYPGMKEPGMRAERIENKPGFPHHYRIRSGNDQNGWFMPAEEIEGWPEFWKEIYEYSISFESNQVSF